MAFKVVIADDHKLILESLVRALAAAPDFEVVGQTDSGAHGLPLVSRLLPDLVLLDIHMPVMDGLTCLDLIRKRHPDTKVVMVSASRDPDEIQAALRRGASGYLVKNINPADIPAALRQALEGTAFYALGQPEGADRHVAESAGLTERELEILKAVARGLSNKQISEELWVTEQTVKFHLKNVYRKLDVPNRAGAVRYAHQQGLVAADDS